MTGEEFVGSNQYADNQSGNVKTIGVPQGPQINDVTLDLEAVLMAGTMMNLGKVGDSVTYRGLPNGRRLTVRGLSSPDNTALCKMLQRAIGAVDEAAGSPAPISPFNHW